MAFYHKCQLLGQLFTTLFNRNGRAAETTVKNAPPEYDIKPTAPLVQVKALIGNALLLKDGTLVRMLEVAPAESDHGYVRSARLQRLALPGPERISREKTANRNRREYKQTSADATLESHLARRCTAEDRR